jgi:hypothetical protein
VESDEIAAGIKWRHGLKQPSIARRAGARPVAAGLLVALAAPLVGVFPLLIWSALGLSVHGIPLGDLGPVWTATMAYMVAGIPSIVAGLAVGLAIRSRGWIAAPHWRAVTGILLLAWVTLLSIRVQVQPVSLGLILTLYFIAAVIFASWALRLVIIKLGWMPKPFARPTLVYH